MITYGADTFVYRIDEKYVQFETADVRSYDSIEWAWYLPQGDADEIVRHIKFSEETERYFSNQLRESLKSALIRKHYEQYQENTMVLYMVFYVDLETLSVGKERLYSLHSYSKTDWTHLELMGMIQSFQSIPIKLEYSPYKQYSSGKIRVQVMKRF